MIFAASPPRCSTAITITTPTIASLTLGGLKNITIPSTAKATPSASGLTRTGVSLLGPGAAIYPVFAAKIRSHEQEKCLEEIVPVDVFHRYPPIPKFLLGSSNSLTVRRELPDSVRPLVVISDCRLVSIKVSMASRIVGNSGNPRPIA